MQDPGLAPVCRPVGEETGSGRDGTESDRCWRDCGDRSGDTNYAKKESPTGTIPLKDAHIAALAKK